MAVMIERRMEKEAWQARAQAHEASMRARLEGARAWRRAHGADPVNDFLFQYYSFSPRRLTRWTPGAGVLLEGARARQWRDLPGAVVVSYEGVVIDAARYPARRREALRWIHAMLVASEQRPLHLGCAGMHEWAMLYRAACPRHASVPLRLDAEALARAVEARPVRCTHYDAFRFFTPAARPRNHAQLTREDTLAHEQPGCLHANMDLYKWAYKLYPWIESELIAEAFELALQAREVDMRASPYDLRARGLEAIPVETAEGRRAYREAQRAIAARGQPLRRRLIEVSAGLLARLSSAGESTD